VYGVYLKNEEDEPVALLALMDESAEFAMGFMIEARLSAREGFDMLIGPQPDLLVASSYTHAPMHQKSKISIVTVSVEPLDTLKVGEPYSYLSPEVYPLSLGKYLEQADKGDASTLLDHIDSEMNLFVDYLVGTQFRRDALNRFKFKSINVIEDTIFIAYGLDATTLYSLDPEQVIVTSMMHYAPPDLYAVRSQRVINRREFLSLINK